MSAWCIGSGRARLTSRSENSDPGRGLGAAVTPGMCGLPARMFVLDPNL